MGGHSGGSFAKSDECLQFLEQQVEAEVGRERCNGRKRGGHSGIGRYWYFCWNCVLVATVACPREKMPCDQLHQ